MSPGALRSWAGRWLWPLLLASAAGAWAGVHVPDVEARLAALVGDWTLVGQEETYRETCEWFADRAFVVCRATDRADGYSSVSILGYSKADGLFTYHHYGSRGNSRSETGFPSGPAGIVYTAERRTTSGLVRSTTTLTPERDGRLHFRLERSVNGGPWVEASNFHYVPRAASAATAPGQGRAPAAP
jgi:hypothetical protein